MNDRLRVIRDQIDKGDDVLVVGHGPKPRPARVVEVLRASLRVRYDDAPGLLHTVLFKQVQRVEAVEDPTPPRSSTTRAKPIVEQPAPAAPDADAELEREELSAWLDMGREVKARMAAELDAVTQQVQSLAEDIVSLQRELAETERRKHVLAERVKRFDTVLKW